MTTGKTNDALAVTDVRTVTVGGDRADVSNAGRKAEIAKTRRIARAHGFEPAGSDRPGVYVRARSAEGGVIDWDPDVSELKAELEKQLRRRPAQRSAGDDRR